MVIRAVMLNVIVSIPFGGFEVGILQASNSPSILHVDTSRVKDSILYPAKIYG